MTKQEKQLLLIDLSARLPYGVFVEYDYGDGVKRAAKFHGNYLYLMMMGKLQWKDFKPYLRQLSSMAEKEKVEWFEDIVPTMDCDKQVDFYNKYHFDYRGLIEKGLALEAPKDMYK